MTRSIIRTWGSANPAPDVFADNVFGNCYTSGFLTAAAVEERLNKGREKSVSFTQSVRNNRAFPADSMLDMQV